MFNLIKNLLSKPIQLAHLLFAAIFFLAYYYCKERIYYDGAYYLIQNINGEHFAIEHERFISVLTQILPLAAVKLGLSLKTVLLAYSLGDTLYYYTLFLVCLHWLKDEAAAVTIALLQCLGVMHIFTTPVTELLQGLSLLVVLFAYIRKFNIDSYLKLGVLYLIFTAVIFSHPLSNVLLVMLLVHYLIEFGFKQSKLFYTLLAMLAITIAARYAVIDDYDGQKMLYHLSPEAKAYKQLFSLTYMWEFIPFFIKTYWMPILMLLLSATALWLNDRRKLSLVVLLNASVYVMLIVGTHYLPFLSGYSERLYLPFTLLSALPFSYYVLNNSQFQQWQRYVGIFLFVCIVTRIFMIYNYLEIAKHRVTHIEQVIGLNSGKEHNDFIWDERNVTNPAIKVGVWIPVETLILSALGGKETSTRITTKPASIAPMHGKYIEYRDSILAENAINLNYYKPLTYRNPVKLNTDKENDTSDVFLSNLTLQIVNIPELKSSVEAWPEVSISNKNLSPLYSGLDAEAPLYLTYHWYSDKSEPLVWDGELTPLEVDIQHSFSQGIKVKVPKNKGKYHLVVDLKSGNKWYNLNVMQEVIVK